MKYFTIGIEILSSTIRISQLEKKGSSYEIIKLESLYFDGSSKNAAIVLKPWIDANVSKKSLTQVVLSIPETFTFLRQLDIPKGTQKELAEAIFWEVTAGSSSDLPENPVIQWQIIGKKGNLVKVAVVAIKKDVSEDFNLIFSDLPVVLKAIEPSSISLERIISQSLVKPTLIINANIDDSDLIIVIAGIPVFSSSLPAFKNDKKISKDEIADFIGGLKKTVNYWQGESDTNISQIIITGSQELFNNLESPIKEDLSLPVYFASIKKFNQISLNKEVKSLTDQYLIAIGASLRIISKDFLSEINLLPAPQMQYLEKEKRQQLVRQYLISLIQINFIFIAICLVFIFFINLLSLKVSLDISRDEKFVKNHPAQRLIVEVNTANQLMTKIESIQKIQNGIGTRIATIKQLTPTNIGFSKIIVASTDEEKWDISGTGSREDILAYYAKLQKEAKAKSVFLTYASLNKVTDASFRIIIIW